MAVYAKLDSDNKVINTIIADSMSGNEYVLSPSNGTNAGKDGTYDPATQRFIKPKPFASWNLDSNQEWQPPISAPARTEQAKYLSWDEDNLRWVGVDDDGNVYSWNTDTSTWEAV